MMNYCGYFKLVSAQEGKRLMFKISKKRKFKNKEGIYEWDNPTFYIPTFNEGTYNYVKSYANDGDLVEVEFDFHTWQKEKEDGTKEYFQDCVVSSFTILHKKESAQAETSKETKEPEPAEVPEGFSEVDVTEEDIPF